MIHGVEQVFSANGFLLFLGCSGILTNFAQFRVYLDVYKFIEVFNFVIMYASSDSCLLLDCGKVEITEIPFFIFVVC